MKLMERITKKGVILCICLVLACGVLVTGVCLWNRPEATPDEPETFVYTSFGDSIAAGFALPDYTTDGVLVPDSFAGQFSCYMGADITNQYAASGSTTTDLLNLLDQEEVREQVRRSSVITLAIGSNDLMKPSLQLIYQKIGVRSNQDIQRIFGNNTTTPLWRLKYLVDLIKLIHSDELADEMNRCVESYKTNFATVISTLRQLNDTAAIFVLNYYNPYAALCYGTFRPGDLIQSYLDRMNVFVSELSHNGTSYTVVDVSRLDGDQTNVKLDMEQFLFELDPHPNTAGHSAIAASLQAAYEANHQE